MPAVLIGKKVGMTRLYTEAGVNVPVTIIQAGPCHVTQVKSAQRDGYEAVQIGFVEIKPRVSTMPQIGHDGKAGLAPQRFHREFRVKPEEVENYPLGKTLTVEVFEGVRFVDVIGTSKGKGFQGVMKRWGFKGMCASHGTERKHRSPGTISGRASNRGTGKPKKGIRMSGHMGDRQVTARSLEVVGRDAQNNLLLVLGAVPGANQGVVLIREATRLYKSKANLAKAS
ncbi:MAG: 50S ribosomal protein L3 [Phycisphaeraceae bacterium]|nr:50S ribosomal protein L3 [Phycisphaeraceae bacterium]